MDEDCEDISELKTLAPPEGEIYFHVSPFNVRYSLFTIKNKPKGLCVGKFI